MKNDFIHVAAADADKRCAASLRLERDQADVSSMPG